jgi:hypothetical protein
MPAKQVALLTLWDELHIPHKKKKQVWGPILTIIGFQLDINNMSITLPSEAKDRLISAIQDFINTDSRKRVLHEWQQLSGWISWSLNVFPHLRPALCHIYLKISQKSNKWSSIYINEGVKDDLTWFLGHVRKSSGVFLFRAIDWNPIHESYFELRCDACLEGMGFWSPSLRIGSYSPVPREAKRNKIFFWEAVSVLSALDWFCKKALPLLLPLLLSTNTHFRLTIRTDNMNTVQIFDSLAAQPGYNDILKSAVDLMVHYNVDLRVIHIPGEANDVADAISRRQFHFAQSVIPDLHIFPFQPPQCVLGAAKK